jgi:hypothetical protein
MYSNRRGKNPDELRDAHLEYNAASIHGTLALVKESII